MLSLRLFTLIMFHYAICQARNVVEKVGQDVHLIATGDATLLIPDILTLSLPKVCTGKLHICYEAESLVCNGQKCTNTDDTCPHGSCLINYGTENVAFNNLFDITDQHDDIVGTFKPLTKYCSLKIGASQNFKILQMPNCPVTVIGASLPSVEDGNEDSEEDEKEEAFEVSEGSVQRHNVAHWAFPVGIGSVVLLFFVGISAFGVYKCVKRCNNLKAMKPKPMSLQAKNVFPKSPNPSPSSPVTFRPPTPQTPPVTTTPQNVRSPALPPKSELKQERQTHVGTPKAVIKRDRNADPIRKERPTSKTQNLNTTEMTATVEISPPYEVVARLIEDSARSLNRQGLLRFKGVHPTEVGSLLPPFIQEIHRKYFTASQRRQVDDREITFFLASASVAFKEAKDKLKRIRQDLSRHGAIYERRKWKSFSESTYQYIRLPTTPGFTAWFAFSGEYGGEIGFRATTLKSKASFGSSQSRRF